MSGRLVVRKTYKLYVNGAFPRSESGRTLELEGYNVARASRKDAREAVVAARKGFAGWSACTWDATRRMVVALVEHLGPMTPSGRRGFPSPADMAAAPESFYRDVARAGYRARSLRELAEKAAREPEALERLRQVTWPSSALRRALLEIHGVGPYAAEHLLRLLGRHDYLALDSWCRPKFAQLRGARGPVSDARIARTYARYGAFQGLALWLDLTRDAWSPYVAHSEPRGS